MRAIWSAVSRRRLLEVAVLLPLAFAALQASTNNVKGIDIVVKKKHGGAMVAHQVTGPAGTFVVENVQPGSYTISAELPGGQQQSYSSHSTTITFSALSPNATNEKVKAAAPFAASGPDVTNNTLQVTGALKPGVFLSEDFTLSAPATIAGTISGYVLYCPKGQVERGGKCVNGDIPNNVAGSSDALTHDPRLGTGNGPYKLPPPVPAGAAGVINSSRSNIKNNLTENDPSGPLSITAATCEANSVSITTNYAAPAGSIWVFTNTSTGKATLFPPNQPVHGANSQLRFALDASNAGYRLVIENINGISILPKPYVFACSPLGPSAVLDGQAH